MKLYSIPTGNFKLDGGATFGAVPKTIWKKMYEADENNLINQAMRCLLIDTGDHRVLIDTGCGNKQSAKFYSYYYLNGNDSLTGSLTGAGYSFDDITDVIHTHLHFDHCGGSVVRDSSGELKPAFKNATYWVSEQQWEWALNPNLKEAASYFPENILPLQQSGQLKLLKEEGPLFPGISIRFFNGHTDGQIVVYINYYGNTLIYGGDLIPLAGVVHLPYVPSYDTRPLITLKEKESFLNEVIDQQQTIFLEHDLATECITVKRGARGFEVDRKLTLDEFVSFVPAGE
ncbi:MAG: MBL fold metallo-hydrolase [Bacteroidota bacterium]|nr:MBL fold metallo-hydrolase [Bacteroidota bacterium]